MMLDVQQPWRMVLQVIERLVQLRTVVLAIGNPLHEGLLMVSPVELLSADNLARLWSGSRPVTGGVLFDLLQGESRWEYTLSRHKMWTRFWRA
jgi:hypothetical protein